VREQGAVPGRDRVGRVPPRQGSRRTGAGSAVLTLQSELPLARVVYASATSATELHNLQYLSRLGLWGKGTAFSSFVGFRDEMQTGGAAAKELLPVHLKACGSLVSRLISYDGVTIRVETHHLTPSQAQTYDAATALWQQLGVLLRQRTAKGALPSNAASRFWSAHQRFFRCVVTAAKLPTLHRLLNAGLAEGKSVVVGLLGTGEAYGGGEGADKDADKKADAPKDATQPSSRPKEASAMPSSSGGLPPAPLAILKAVITSVIFPNEAPSSPLLKHWCAPAASRATPSAGIQCAALDAVPLSCALVPVPSRQRTISQSRSS
jgi:hypothetical protein